MDKLDLFLPLLKVDVDRRLVQGVATAEAPDRRDEICDYASTKPYFEAWSEEARQASGGKSLGAVRAMHDRIAAGKLTDIDFDDDNKRILVTAKIVDDDEWQKVQEGVYTGFSQGGRYVRRWPDEATGLTRFTADPTEISLVDVPCLPEATFEVVKGGVSELRSFALPPRTAAHEAGAPAPPAPSPVAQALAKAAGDLAGAADKLEKAMDDAVRLREALAKVEPALSALEARLRKLEAQPMAPRAAPRSLAKAADAGADAPGDPLEAAIARLSGLPSAERALALTKISLANPMTARF